MFCIDGGSLEQHQQTKDNPHTMFQKSEQPLSRESDVYNPLKEEGMRIGLY